jgi:DNA-binding MarR family transcriptional regulator
VTRRTDGSPRHLAEELGKRDPFVSPAQEAYLNLLRSASTLAGAFETLFAEHGLSQPLYNVLRIVAGHGPGGVRSQQIAKDLITRGPDVTRLVDRLVRAGHVERRPCKDDRRVVYVHLTRSGRGLLKKLRKRVDELHVQQLGHLSEKELGELSRLLFLARHPEQV